MSAPALLSPDAATRSEDFRIRAYHAEDHPTLVALWEAAGMRPFSAAQVDRLRAGGGNALVVEIADTVVGALLWSHNGMIGLVWRLTVHPDCRRRGIARRLLHRAEADIRAAGFAGMGLLVREANAAAKSLYAGEGWQRNDDMEFWGKRFPPLDPAGRNPIR